MVTTAAGRRSRNASGRPPASAKGASGITYASLLGTARIRTSTRGQLSILQAVESDRARVIYSAAFRRLQGKTQVFPLDENAAVRTRLTHSLEVAHVGRFLANSVLEEFDRRKLSSSLGLSDANRVAFATVTETACLLHDIGNPPFGHFGEAAIRNWFQEFDSYPAPELKQAVRSSELFLDLTKFDGNSQGFRIATRLAGEDHQSGLNLTLSQLAAMLKYSCLPSELERLPRLKKAGVFETESSFLERIRGAFDLNPGQRFPLAYLMEAADDISYCLSDIEDGIEKNILTHEEAINGILDECSGSPSAKRIVMKARREMRKASSVAAVVAFRSSIIRSLVEWASQEYVSKHKVILSGRIRELIADSTDHGQLLRAVKSFSQRRLYRHRIPQSLELSGASIVQGILDKYGLVLRLTRKDMQRLMSDERAPGALATHARLLTMIADRHKRVYSASLEGKTTDLEEWCLRAHMVVDYLSGMTDQFALSTYQRLLGIKL